MRSRVAAAALAAALLAVLPACLPAAEAVELRALLQNKKPDPKFIVPGFKCIGNKKPRGAPRIVRVTPRPKSDTAFWTLRRPAALPKNGKAGCIDGAEYAIVEIRKGVRTQAPTDPKAWIPVPNFNNPSTIEFENTNTLNDRTRYRLYARWVNDNQGPARLVGNPSSNTATLEAPGS